MRYPRLIALIFLGFVLRAQNPFYTTFNKTRDLAPGEQDQAITAFDIKDKILCLSSYYSWAYNSWGMVSSVWDSSGTFLSKTTFIDSTYFSLSVLKAIQIDHRVVYGTGYIFKRQDTINNLDLYFVKYDANGDTVFTRRFIDTGAVLGIDLVSLQPNLFAVLCQSTADYKNGAILRTSVVLLDSSGNLIKQTYCPPSAEYPFYLTHDPVNRDLYVFGICQSPQPPASSYNLFSFARVFDDSTLSLKYSKFNMSGPESLINSVIYYKGSIYGTFSEDVWLPPFGFPGNRIVLLKMGLRSTGLANKGIYVVPPDDTTGNAGTANLLADGDRILFAGFNGYTGLLMYFCDTTLHELCRARIPGPVEGSDLFYNFSFLTRSKKILHLGYTVDSTQLSANSAVVSWISSSMNSRKYVDEGCGDFAGITQLYNNKACRIFPNPCKDHFEVKADELNRGLVRLQLVDALGRICLDIVQDIAADSRISSAYLNPGVYTLVISDKESIWFGKIVRE